MLSGIGVEQLRQGEQPKTGLFASALAFVLGFSVVFIGFGASASAVGGFLRQNRSLLAPVAGALIILFGLHLLGGLIRMNIRGGIIIGGILVALGIAATFSTASLPRPRRYTFFSLHHRLWPATRPLPNQDVRLRNTDTKPGIVAASSRPPLPWLTLHRPDPRHRSGLAAASDTVARGVCCSPSILRVLCSVFATALGLSQFLRFTRISANISTR
jgi:hypothetical protein